MMAAILYKRSTSINKESGDKKTGTETGISGFLLCLGFIVTDYCDYSVKYRIHPITSFDVWLFGWREKVDRLRLHARSNRIKNFKNVIL